MKALVTGGSSFVGSRLIEELDTIGFEVRTLIRKNAPTTNSVDLKCEKIEGDLNQFDALCHAVKGVDYIFHLAAATTAPSFSSFFQYNALGTENLAKAAASINPDLSGFVYVSSLAAGGPSQSLSPRTEQELDRPISFYGKSRLQGEQKLLHYRRVFPISIVRPPWVYGPKDRLIHRMIQTLKRNLLPILQGSGIEGHKYYSTIHAQDLCRGIVQAALASKELVASGEIFYLSGDGVHTYQDLIQAITDCLNYDPTSIKIPKSLLTGAVTGLNMVQKLTQRKFGFALNQLNDKLNDMIPDYWICSNKKAKRLIEFSPEYDIVNGIADTIEWYRRKKWI